jgi:hypothetical protein
MYWTPACPHGTRSKPVDNHTYIDYQYIESRYRGFVMGQRQRGQLWLVQLLLAVAAFVAGVIPVIEVFQGNIRVPLPAALVPETWPGAGIGNGSNIVLDHQGMVGVTVVHPAATERLWAALALLPSAVVIVTVLGLLISVLGVARRKSPFMKTVVRRLRIAGSITVLGGLAAMILEGVASANLLSSSAVLGAAASLNHHWIVWLVAGVGLEGLAGVFQRGAVMREELSEVI